MQVPRYIGYLWQNFYAITRLFLIVILCFLTDLSHSPRKLKKIQSSHNIRKWKTKPPTLDSRDVAGISMYVSMLGWKLRPRRVLNIYFEFRWIFLHKL